MLRTSPYSLLNKGTNHPLIFSFSIGTLYKVYTAIVTNSTNLYIMNIIARSKQFLYIYNGIKVISVQLNHSESQIENDFATLPFVNNLDEARELIKS